MHSNGHVFFEDTTFLSLDEHSIIREALHGFEFRFCSPLVHNFANNTSVRSFGGNILFVRTRSLNGATESQKQCARDLGLNKRGRGCVLGSERPELLGKARKIQHLLLFTFLPAAIPEGRFKFTSRGQGMTIRYENFSDVFGSGESVVLDSDEYVRVETQEDKIGAVWTSLLTASQTFNVLLDVLGDGSNEGSGHIVIEEIDGSRWEADGTANDIREFASEEPERVVSAVLETGQNRLRWARPEFRIKSATQKTAEIGLVSARKTFEYFPRILASTATHGINSNPILVVRRVKQLAPTGLNRTKDADVD